MRRLVPLILIAAVSASGAGIASAQDDLPLNPPPPAPAVGVPAVTPLSYAEEDRAVQLGLPLPSRWRPGSPQRAVAELLDVWHDRAWDRMTTWTAASWRAVRTDPSDALRRQLGDWRVQGWDLRVVHAHGDRAHGTVSVAYRRFVGPRVRRQVLDLRLVREDGRWGVRF